MKIEVDYSQETGTLNHFWESTGFTPAELLLEPEMQQAITYYGSVANNGIKYVRIHYLLNLVTATNLESDNAEYDWSQLDQGLDLLIDNDLKPFFELMGNPAPDFFNNFEEREQVYAWKNFIKELTLHYIDRYGLSEVKSWYFESTNEPDIDNFKWGWGDTSEAFCNYYDACSQGLMEAEPELCFGGPGTALTLSSIFKDFLEHCDRGKNFFTDNRDVRLDFISVHEKGVTAHQEDLNPDSIYLCDQEKKAIEYIRKNHPDLTQIPFINNECDPQVGWSDIHTWRSHPYYPAIACKLIDLHQKKIIDGLDCEFSLLSNDNGFMGTWGQRTLLTLLGEQQELKAGKFAQIKKPVLNLMSMLSLLGDKLVDYNISDQSQELEEGETGVIATKTSDADDQIAVLVYNSRDKIMSSDEKNVQLYIEGISFKDAMLAHYRIDENQGYPYQNWEDEIIHSKPSAKQLQAMRNQQELTIMDKSQIEIRNGSCNMSFDLPLPGLSLILISKKPTEKPGQVTNLSARCYPGLTDKEEVMLSWKDIDSKYIQSYEVLYATDPEDPYHKINDVDLIDTCFIHMRNMDKTGYYKVKAVDYWGREGEASQIINL